MLYVRSRPVGVDTDALYQALIQDARPLGMAVIDGASETATDIERTVENFARRLNGGLTGAFDAFITVNRDQLLQLAARYRLPAVYPLPAFTRGGGLLSYGIDQDEQFRQAADYVARVGEKTSQLPVQIPTKFRLALNLKTAKELDLAVPPTVLAVADEVIE